MSYILHYSLGCALVWYGLYSAKVTRTISYDRAGDEVATWDLSGPIVAAVLFLAAMEVFP